jgi:hypothetical protein
VTLNLGALPNSSQTVAPFWVQAPDTAAISMVWWNESIGPFHQASQPGKELKLFSKTKDRKAEVAFTAVLSAELTQGKSLEKMRKIPVRIESYPLA